MLFLFLHKRKYIVALLMSTHNICFYREKKNINIRLLKKHAWTISSVDILDGNGRLHFAHKENGVHSRDTGGNKQTKVIHN